MANEITANIKLSVANGNLSDDMTVNGKIDQTTARSFNPVIDVGTSEEVISTGDIGTLGLVAFYNLDATNYVEIGPESGGSMVSFIKLKAGERALLRLTPGITIRAQANTATVKLQMLLLDD